MTTKAIRAKQYICDGCGQEFIIPLSDPEPPFGFHGEVIEISDAGGRGGKWFACGERCIEKAVLKASNGETE